VPPRLGLKWPNDVLLIDPSCVGRKLGGILIETLATPAGRLAVVGVGLNLQAVAGPADAAPPPWGQAHLNELWPGLDAPTALARVAPGLLATLLAFEQQGFAPLATRYSQRDVLRGLAVQTSLPQLPHGVADGVDAQGMLWLRQGEQRFAVGSGEVSLRRAGSGPTPC
jgi:BirA family biotin operon repressor/biotin-[acetyl-CoA-carboxylase] ligase